MGARIGIAGAGVLGRLLAWRLARAGHRVQVFDAACDAQPRFGGAQAAAFSAAGMLSPLAELDTAHRDVAQLGLRSLEAWCDIAARLGEPGCVARQGSLLLAHRGDDGAVQRMLARLHPLPDGVPPVQWLTAAELAQLEPALHGVARAWLLPGEGQVDPLQAMQALHDDAARHGADWAWAQPVAAVVPNAIVTADGIRHRCDWAFDVRGLGARDDADWTGRLRGVRGETVWLQAPGHGLTRPVRLVHPRHRVYLVPRAGDVVLVGATEVESEDRSPVSLRSAVELMAAAHSVMPSLAEARIVRLDANLRPALPDHRPRTEHVPGRVRINGLYRHGWMVAPALVDDALAECGL